MALLESGKRLTADEEVIVFRYYHEHTTPEMRNQIALNNLGLVHSVINNYTYSGIPAEDLQQEGVCGLLIAIDKYDYTKGFKFSTYSMHWIKQAIGRYVMNNGRTIRMPVHILEKYSMIHRCIADNKINTFHKITDPYRPSSCEPDGYSDLMDV